MQTAVINLRVEPQTKAKAQKLARQLGLSLSSAIEALLTQFIRSKTIYLSTREQPTEYMLQALKESKEDIKAGRAISFKNSRQGNYSVFSSSKFAIKGKFLLGW